MEQQLVKNDIDRINSMLNLLWLIIEKHLTTEQLNLIKEDLKKLGLSR